MLLRHNAAVGALVGLAVGDALSTLTELPPAVCGGPSELPPWGDVAAISFETGEALLSRDLVNMGLGPTDIIAAAIALADPDTSPPLLGDPDAVLMCALVQGSMLGPVSRVTHRSPPLRRWLTPSVPSKKPRTSVALSVPLQQRRYPSPGAVAGLRWGPGAIPADMAHPHNRGCRNPNLWASTTAAACRTAYATRRPCSARTSPLTRPPRSCPWAVSLQLASPCPGSSPTIQMAR